MSRLSNGEKRFIARLLYEYADDRRSEGWDDSDGCVSQPEALAVRVERSQRIETVHEFERRTP
jgi:Uma2 family endonuclease